MMRFITNLPETIKLFFDKKIAHNARLLLSLIGVIVLLSLFRKSLLLEIKTNYGNTGIGICILLLWLIFFIPINLIADRLSNHRKLRIQRNVELKQQEQNIREIYDNLDILSESQKSLLARFILQNKRQFQNYEIGGYEAVWGKDITVLLTKGIIRKLDYGLYEINKEYFDRIKEYFDTNDSEKPT